MNGVNPTSEKFAFPWPIFKLVLEGTSILDVPRLETHTMEEATSFIKAYGFDIADPADMESLWGFFDEAVSFIEKSLADSEFPRVPDHLRTRKAVSDVRRLLLIVSDRNGHQDAHFSCA
ncbi:hypothetical protein K2X33_01160, partial [bacterium]|nr:hypothetical protein [bacterium]